jgi:hypothetical protein
VNWNNASDENHGFSVYYYDDEERPGIRYVIHHKRGGTGLWKLLIRETPDEPLRVIYVGQTMKECKAYAEEYRALRKTAPH